MSDDASIKVSVDGNDEVRRAFEQIAEAAKKLSASVNDVGKSGSSASDGAKKATSAWKSFSNDLKGEIASSVKTITTTITALNTISFAQAISQNRDYQQSLARMAYGAGKSTTDLRANIRGVANATLEDERVTQAWAKSVGLVTGNYGQAIDMSRAFSAEALATGEDLADFTGTASTFSLGFGIKDASGVTKELETIRTMASALGTTGGPIALRGQIESLLGPTTQLAVATESQRRKMEAWTAAIGKGYTPQQASRIQSSLAGFVEGNARGISRQLGTQVLDDQGHVKDLPATLSKMKDYYARHYGKNARTVAMSQLGNEQGAALFNFDQTAYQAALVSKPGNAGAAATAAFKASEEGRSKAAQLKSDQARRDVAQSLSPMMTSIQEWAANNPKLALAGSLGGGGVATALLKLGGRSLLSGLPSAGSGLAAMGGGGLGGFLLAGLGVTAAGAAGYGVGTLADKASGGRISDFVSGNMGHLSRKEEEDLADKKLARQKEDSGVFAGIQKAASSPEDFMKFLQQSLTTNTEEVASSIAKGFSGAKISIPINIIVDKDGKIESILQQNSKQ